VKRKTQLDKQYTLDEGTTKFKHLLGQYRQLYQSKKMTDEDALKLSQDIRNLLETLQDRNEYWEQRRGLFLQIALGMMAFSIAIGTAIAAVFDRLMTHPFTFIIMGAVIAISLTVLIAGIAIIRIWNRQNNPDYPFTKGYRHWRWQYRYAEEIIPEFKYRYESKEEFEKDVETYIRNLHSYAEKTLNITPMEILEQDISQLFLLIENEKYKIKFISELRDEVTRWLSITLWVGAASVVICILLVVFGAYNIVASDFINETMPINQTPSQISY
jgi:hypothetical protein